MNWEEAEKNAGGNKRQQYKEYAPNGEHTVKLDSVEVVDKATWKSPAVRFTWAEDDKYKYSKSINHWLSTTNPSWRAVHQRNILMALGIEKEKAQQLVGAIEEQKDLDRAKLVKGYEAMWKRVAERHPETKIVIQDQWRDGKPVTSSNGTVYHESDFSSTLCRMMEEHAVSDADPLEGAEGTEDIDLSTIPF